MELFPFFNAQTNRTEMGKELIKYYSNACQSQRLIDYVINYFNDCITILQKNHIQSFFQHFFCFRARYNKTLIEMRLE